MRLPSTVVIVGLLYAADAPPTPIMSYYSFLNVSLHFKVRVIFPGGSTDPPCPTWLRPWSLRSGLLLHFFKIASVTCMVIDAMYEQRIKFCSASDNSGKYQNNELRFWLKQRLTFLFS